jgi:hypothetical protein
LAVSDNLNREITEERLLAAHNGVRPGEIQKEAEGSRWQPGQSGCPNGRPKGARNKLSEAFLQALADDFEVNGKAVVEKVRTERPHDYLKVCASVMPKRFENEDVTTFKGVREMTNAELLAIVSKGYEEAGIRQPY